MWTLRIRANGETAQLHDVDPDGPLAALQRRIADATKIPEATQRISAGFPPKPIEALAGTGQAEGDGGAMADGAATESASAGAAPPLSVRAVGIVNCDTLIVSTLDTAPRQASGPPQKKRAPPAKRKRGDDGEKEGLHGASGEARPWQDSVAEGLLKAASASGDAELEAELVPMRKALKEHLKQREQERLANQRLSAMLGLAYEMEASLGGRLGDSMPSLRVSFSVGARKIITEDFLMMGKPLLRAIVQNIVKDPDARENLRLFNMAFFSPRVFWNLAYHFQDPEDPDCDMDAKLMELAPDADWSFLEARKRNLSERALQNRFQAEEERTKSEAAKAARALRAAKKQQTLKEHSETSTPVPKQAEAHVQADQGTASDIVDGGGERENQEEQQEEAGEDKGEAADSNYQRSSNPSRNTESSNPTQPQPQSLELEAEK